MSDLVRTQIGFLTHRLKSFIQYFSETMGFVPNESSDLDTNDLEYDFMEDSSESCASQPTRISKLGRILGSLRGRPT